MKIIDGLIGVSRGVFKLTVMHFDVFDILFAVTNLPNFPIDEDGELLELENYGVMGVTDTKLVFYCGGDWQTPTEIVVELVNGMPTITDSRIISDFSSYAKNELDEDTVYELFGLAKL